MADGADVLVIGGGPAALCIASELHQRGVAVEGIAPNPVDAPWPNTYGIWAKELELLGLEDLLEHRWSHTVSFYGAGGSDADDQAHNSTGWITGCLIGTSFSSTGWAVARESPGIKTASIASS